MRTGGSPGRSKHAEIARITGGVQYFHKKRETEPGIIPFDELELNSLGYLFLQNGQIKDAIKLFELNTIDYPESGNVYDSLGEACLKDGQEDRAIKNYEKAVELDPDNTNAKEILKDLIEPK